MQTRLISSEIVMIVYVAVALVVAGGLSL